ncbi:MAG: M50 family metallopeptidase [Emergencia sp.]|nr:M50 family metallopeptidase [Emergencia sp.]
MENKKKVKAKLVSTLPYIVGMICGGLLGYFGMEIFSGHGLEIPLLILSFAVIVYVLIITHEAGHLVCGLLSGYKFVSFRIGSLIFVKQEDKILRKKFSIPGTGGQCLLDPPDKDEDGGYPAVLYNLGGGLSNLLFSAAGFIGMSLCPQETTGRMICLILGLMGLYFAVTNLVPLKMGGVANDGYNIKTFRSDKESADAFWRQMRINKLQQTDGKRLAEMPEEYFVVPEGDFSGNPLVEAIAFAEMQRRMDEGRFDEAQAAGYKLFSSPKLLPFYKNFVQMELLFLELIGQCRKEEVDRLYTKQLKKFMKSIKGYPNTQRTLYAYAVRFSKDEEAAKKAKANFEKVLKTYPTPGEIRTEQKLMEVV